MEHWYSENNLRQAWKYVKNDIKDDFVFDIIDYEDIKNNIGNIIYTLSSQLQNEQYYPSPVMRISVPKNYHSVRPGTVVPAIDLLVLYAIIQQLAPFLDKILPESAYAYRINPKSKKSGEHLFRHKSPPNSENDNGNDDNDSMSSKGELNINFPYNWFINWIKFHDSTMKASGVYEYAAQTDIAAYFENISLDLLREILKENLYSEHRTLIDRLFRLLEYWDWTPSGNLPQGIGLIQGNDVASFLSNLYLLDLDKEMLDTVSGDSSKYYRYVDDIVIFTSDKDEARRSLVKLEKVLRTLNLNIQSAKTKIIPADEIYDYDVESWLDKMSNKNDQRYEYANEFINTVFKKDDIDKWKRVYSRCLSIFIENNDDQGFNISLDIFLDNPSHKLLQQNFKYLKYISPIRSNIQKILDRLSDGAFTFPFHKAYMYRLAAYSRETSKELKNVALQDSTDDNAHWFCRLAALFCLNSFSLSGFELSKIANLIKTETNPHIIRPAYVLLCQYSNVELERILYRLTFFNAPHQEYFKRYLFKLYRDQYAAEKNLKKVKSASFKSASYIHHIHKLDVLKTSSHVNNRKLFKDIIEDKIYECSETLWPRLYYRLYNIKEAFVLGSKK